MEAGVHAARGNRFVGKFGLILRTWRLHSDLWIVRTQRCRAGTMGHLRRRRIRAGRDDTLRFRTIGDSVNAPLHAYFGGPLARIG